MCDSVNEKCPLTALVFERVGPLMMVLFGEVINFWVGIGRSLAKEENTTLRVETDSENLEACHTSSSCSLPVFTAENVISGPPV